MTKLRLRLTSAGEWVQVNGIEPMTRRTKSSRSTTELNLRIQCPLTMGFVNQLPNYLVTMRLAQTPACMIVRHYSPKIPFQPAGGVDFSIRLVTLLSKTNTTTSTQLNNSDQLLDKKLTVRQNIDMVSDSHPKYRVNIGFKK